MAGHPDESVGTARRPLITFEGVSLGYGRRRVLAGLDFTLYEGDYLGIVGPNGAGKTTLLKGMLGALAPREGRITRLRPAGGVPRFGYVPQLNTVDDTYPLTALEVVLMGRYRRLGLVRRPRAPDREKALFALEQVGMADLAARLYRDLSGGQKQRVLVARALACDPDILALDEPTNDMDVAAEKAVMELIGRLHGEAGLTILMVSHLLNLVLGNARRVAFLGTEALQVLPVEEAATPDHLERLYGVRLRVVDVGGRRAILP